MAIQNRSSISSFLAYVSKNGGMSTSTNFIVESGFSAGALNQNEAMLFLCDEAQLPNINTATGTQNGVLTGIGSVDYPHTRIYTEIQLSFMLDANLSLLKYFNEWYAKIFEDDGGSIHSDDFSISLKNRATRVRYRSEYATEIKITKAEPGPQGADQRKPITYVLENAWPYSIDAVPLQFGSSQITRLTVNFKYERHQIVHRDIRYFPNITKGQVKKIDQGLDFDDPAFGNYGLTTVNGRQRGE